MADNADLKIDRATKHVIELNKLIQKNPPFSYCSETNTLTGDRALFAKKDETIINQVSLICGDAIQNLRSALDHTYWYLVSNSLPDGSDLRGVQFPFSETMARLDEGAKNRLANKVSPSFFKAIIDLKPHGEPGGNELLYMIHKLGIIDRHKLLIPLADYKKVSFELIRTQIPDLPPINLNIGIGSFGKDVVWRVYPWSRTQRRRERVPANGIVQQKLNVPIDVVFSVSETGSLRPMIPTLYELVEVVKAAVAAMRAA